MRNPTIEKSKNPKIIQLKKRKIENSKNQGGNSRNQKFR